MEEERERWQIIDIKGEIGIELIETRMMSQFHITFITSSKTHDSRFPKAVFVFLFIIQLLDESSTLDMDLADGWFSIKYSLEVSQEPTDRKRINDRIVGRSHTDSRIKL